MKLAPIVLATTEVFPSEPCLSLSETNRVLPVAGAGLHRIQTIRVVRNDKPFECVFDMGPASKFTTEEFIFQGAVPLSDGRYDVLETVERLKDAANDFRARYDKPTERRDPPDFVKGFEEMATRRRDARVGRKRFAVKGLGR